MKPTGFAVVLGAMLAVASSTPAYAVTLVDITDLYNTGMSDPWNDPTPGAFAEGSADSHWTVDPPGATPVIGTKVLNNDTGRFNGLQSNRWQLNLNKETTKPIFDQSPATSSPMYLSQWLAPGNYGPGNASPTGLYVYQTTFTALASATSINIAGLFKAPPTVSGSFFVQLNNETPVALGHTLANVRPPNAPEGFAITGSGGLTTNTLRFIFNSSAGGGAALAGLRVQFTNANFVVPEPTTMCLSAIGLIGLGVSQWRRRKLTTKV